MKEKLIELLGLDAKAEDAAIIGAVGKLVAASKKTSQDSAFEKQIADKIAASGGALNREQAIAVIEGQKANDKKK